MVNSPEDLGYFREYKTVPPQVKAYLNARYTFQWVEPTFDPHRRLFAHQWSGGEITNMLEFSIEEVITMYRLRRLYYNDEQGTWVNITAAMNHKERLDASIAGRAPQEPIPAELFAAIYLHCNKEFWEGRNETLAIAIPVLNRTEQGSYIVQGVYLTTARQMEAGRPFWAAELNAEGVELDKKILDWGGMAYHRQVSFEEHPIHGPLVTYLTRPWNEVTGLDSPPDYVSDL